VQPHLTRLGWSKAKWASEAGVDPSVVYGYLDGSSDPRPDTRKVLAEALGIEINQLPQ
jgi:ribosome-binding protein aMBF1 (putative translation factor)